MNVLDYTSKTYHNLWGACDEAGEQLLKLDDALDDPRTLAIGGLLIIIAKSVLLLVSVTARANKEMLVSQEVEPGESGEEGRASDGISS